MFQKMIPKGNCKIFAAIFLSVLFFTWISIGAYFYEDSIYLHYATSAVKDFDFNIINQIGPNFGHILTTNYSHPAHHTVIQTPLLVLLNAFDGLLNAVFTLGALKVSTLAGTLLSLIGLMIGFLYTQKGAALLGVRLKNIHFFFYLFSTSLFYFSFFTLTTIEVFLFALSGFAFYGVMRLYKHDTEKREGFTLGAALAMLLTSKIMFLWLAAIGTYFAFTVQWKNNRKFLIQYAGGFAVIFLIAYLKDLASYGKVVMISRTLGLYITHFNFYDLGISIRQGMFGEGGMFYSNVPFMLSFIGMVIFYFRNAFKSLQNFFLWNALLLWMCMSYFHTVLLVGPLLDDHYLGRPMLTALPMMLLGLAFLTQRYQSKYAKGIKIILGVLLVAWQGYTLSNYLTISAGGHYAYASMKTVPHFSDLVHHLAYMARRKTEIMIADFAKFILFVLISSTLLYFIYTRREKLSFPLTIYFQYSTAFLLVFCVLNLMNSKNNGMKFVRANELEELVTITDHEAVYSFIYITDAFRSQHYNCKDPELRKIISEKHAAYLDIVKPLVKKASPELQRALDEKDLNYSFYSN